MSWQVLKLGNEQRKTLQVYYYGWKWHLTPIFCVDKLNSTRQVLKKENLVTCYKSPFAERYTRLETLNY